jgi:spermidine/putrescine ABC transporter substrate binding protein
MIGEFYATEENKKNYLNNGIVENLTMNNYREIIDYFVEFVQEATGHSIKDANYNKLVTSGLDLVHDIIEPTTTKADIAIMYNGDALDSYYAEDNFASLKDVQINYKRPKNNYMLLDA